MGTRYTKSQLFNAAMLGLGVVALAFLINRLGWAGLSAVFARVGVWFVLIAVIDLVSLSCDAFALQGFLRAQVEGVSYGRVFAAQASGLAVNRVSPANAFGEPVKVTMLLGHVPSEAAVSAVVMFNVMAMFLGVATLVIGVPITVMLLDLPRQIEVVVLVATGILVVAMLVLGLTIRRGAVGTILDGLVKIRIVSVARADRWRLAITGIDGHVRRLGDARSGSPRGFLGLFGARVFNWLGTVVLLHAADLPLTPTLVVASLSVGQLITWVSGAMPLGLGLADGGNYALYGALGLGAETGLVFAMVNRARTCFLALMGLTIMAIAHATNPLVPRRR